MRGYEDEQPSLYVSYASGDITYLGRVDLDYFQTLLKRYTSFSGHPVLLSTATGVVMINSYLDVQLPIIPGYETLQAIPSEQTIFISLLTVIALKNKRITSLIIRPLERLSSRIDALAANQPAPLLPIGDY